MKKQIGVFLFFVFFVTFVQAQSFSSSCITDGNPIDECVVTNPKILNVFWSTSEAQWDADAGPDLSMNKINAYVRALTRSSYFSSLSQYGISSPEFLEGVISGGSCQNPNTVGGSPPTADFIAMDNLMNCVKVQNLDRFENCNMVVLFLPPQVTNSIFPVVGSNTTGNCILHLILAGIPTAIIPLRCFDPSGSGDPISGAIRAISRELVQAMTNPDPLVQSGFVDRTEGASITIGPFSFAPEIGDVCNDQQGTFFLGGITCNYWSEVDKSCVSGHPNVPFTDITSIEAIGSGKNMKIIVNGSNFGSLPEDLQFVDNLSATSLYFRLNLTNGNRFTAGNSFNIINSGIGVRFESWSDTQIKIIGFGGTYGSPEVLLPGDNINIHVTNQNDGRSDVGSVRVPLPRRILIDPIDFSMLPASTSMISGRLVDANNGAEGNVPFILTASEGTLTTSEILTDDNGNFIVEYTAPETAGMVVMSANFPSITNVIQPIRITFNIPVVPIIENVVPECGNRNGTTSVTITGHGFDSEDTRVLFGNRQVVPQIISNSVITVLAPAVASVGVVPLTVAVDGIHSTPANEFLYIIPFAPIFSFRRGAECASVVVTAQIFNAECLPVVNEPVTLTAVTGKLVSSSSEQVQTLTLNTDASGKVQVKMISFGNSNSLTIKGHTATRTEDESASTEVIAKNLCDKMKYFHKLNLKIRFAIGEQLIPEILYGCFDCELPSKFQVKWHSNTPILKSIVVTGHSDDISLAENYRISILGADKASPILKKHPITNEVVGLIQFDGEVGKSTFVLDYTPANKVERYTLFKLNNGKWIEAKSTKLLDRGLKSQLSSSGIYAIVVRP